MSLEWRSIDPDLLVALSGSTSIARVSQEANKNWFWTMSLASVSLPPNGTAETLERAKEKVEACWTMWLKTMALTPAKCTESVAQLQPMNFDPILREALEQSNQIIEWMIEFTKGRDIPEFRIEELDRHWRFIDAMREGEVGLQEWNDHK